MLDKFGIKELYPSNPDGEEWYLSDNPNVDGRLITNGVNIQQSSNNGYFFIKDPNPTVRLSVLTSRGEPATNCNLDFAKLSNVGYRHTLKDFTNVEMTFVGYIQNVENIDTKDGYLFLEARSGKKVDPRPCCDGHSYGANAYWAKAGKRNAGKTGFIKSMFYNSNKILESDSSIVNSFFRTWFGLKFVIFNYLGPDNKLRVRLEKYYCPSDFTEDLANKWFPIGTVIDSGSNWGKGGSQCGGTDRQAITWGSYRCNFGFVGGPAEIRFKNLSVREIDPDSDFTKVTSGSSSGAIATSGPINEILYNSAVTACNGVSREIHGHESRDPYDNVIAIASGDKNNRSITINGSCQYLISGNNTKLKLYIENYDAQLEYKFTPNSTLDNYIAARLRSRLNKGGNPVNRFGGYECKIKKLNEVQWLREDYKGKYTILGSTLLPQTLENDTEYKVKVSVKDDSNKSKSVSLKCEIDFNDGNGFTLVSNTFDNDAQNYMIDRSLYFADDFDTIITVSSYAWLQVNGTNPTSVKIKDIILRNISDVIGGSIGA